MQARNLCLSPPFVLILSSRVRVSRGGKGRQRHMILRPQRIHPEGARQRSVPYLCRQKKAKKERKESHRNLQCRYHLRTRIDHSQFECDNGAPSDEAMPWREGTLNPALAGRNPTGGHSPGRSLREGKSRTERKMGTTADTALDGRRTNSRIQPWT